MQDNFLCCPVGEPRYKKKNLGGFIKFQSTPQFRIQSLRLRF